MGTRAYIKGVLVATWTGIRHLFHPRMTLRYPEQKLDLEYAGYPVSPRRPAGLPPGYKYDPLQGVGIAGFKGRHILYFERCTGCQLCAIACDGVAVAIEMQKVPKGRPQNKKDVWPAVDYGRCVPAGTPVTTAKGIMPIEQVKTGDKVLTHRGNFKTVTQTFRRKYSGVMFTFRTLGNDERLSVTEGHPILAYSGGATRWVDPAVVRYGTYLTRPIGAGVKEVTVLSYNDEEISQVPERNNPPSSGSHVMTTGDMILSPVVELSVREALDEDVYNLEVEDDNSYVASNVSVHNCVFCALCVDACPFDALYMTDDYELSAYDKMGLKYTPDMLSVPPKLEGKKYKVELDTETGEVRYG